MRGAEVANGVYNQRSSLTLRTAIAVEIVAVVAAVAAVAVVVAFVVPLVLS